MSREIEQEILGLVQAIRSIKKINEVTDEPEFFMPYDRCVGAIKDAMKKIVLEIAPEENFNPALVEYKARIEEAFK